MQSIRNVSLVKQPAFCSLRRSSNANVVNELSVTDVIACHRFLFSMSHTVVLQLNAWLPGY